MPDAFEHCATLVREHDKDRFLAAVFAPEDRRRHVLALYAFNLEIARVREMVSNPLPGEIRLQWWRDAIDRREPAANPVATALLETIEKFRLPVAALQNLIDARVFDLYDDPMPSLADLEGYAGETASAVIQLSAIILNGGDDPGTHEAAGHAGVAYALTGLLRSLPIHAARGQCFMPKDVLARYGAGTEDIIARRVSPGLLAALGDLVNAARGHQRATEQRLATIPAAVGAAFLPNALVEAYLKRLLPLGRDPFREVVDLPGWLRPILLWRGSRKIGRAGR